MELIRGLHNLKPHHRGCVATIGNFDGVHLGHQQVLGHVQAAAKRLACPSLVIIFEPQPREYFTPDTAPARLTRLRDKIKYLAEAGIDAVLCLPFNERLRALPALAFINAVLLEGLRVRHFVVGDDFRFGCDRAGDFSLLRQVGEARGFEVVSTDTFLHERHRVSSSRIRQLLELGELALANELLGRDYSISGRVEYGKQLGRTIGVPTANVALKNRAPAIVGVYAVKMKIQDQWHNGVANIGTRPTVSGQRYSLEVHVLDYAGNLYGRHVEVVFCQYLRSEQRFDGLDALKLQISHDIANARRYFER